MQRMSVVPGAYPHHITSARAARASHECIALSDPACDDGIRRPSREETASFILPPRSYRLPILTRRDVQ